MAILSSYVFLFFLFALSIASATIVEDMEYYQAIEMRVPNHGKLNGENNHVDLQILYAGPGNLTVVKSWLKWGKWVPGDGNYHTYASSPDGKSVQNGTKLRVAAGKHMATSGTEGDIYLAVSETGQIVLYIYWDAGYLYDMAKLKVEKRNETFGLTWGKLGTGGSGAYVRICFVYPGYDGKWCQIWCGSRMCD